MNNRAILSDLENIEEQSNNEFIFGSNKASIGLDGPTKSTRNMQQRTNLSFQDSKKLKKGEEIERGSAQHFVFSNHSADGSSHKNSRKEDLVKKFHLDDLDFKDNRGSLVNTRAAGTMNQVSSDRGERSVKSGRELDIENMKKEMIQHANANNSSTNQEKGRKSGGQTADGSETSCWKTILLKKVFCCFKRSKRAPRTSSTTPTGYTQNEASLVISNNRGCLELQEGSLENPKGLAKKKPALPSFIINSNKKVHRRRKNDHFPDDNFKGEESRQKLSYCEGDNSPKSPDIPPRTLKLNSIKKRKKLTMKKDRESFSHSLRIQGSQNNSHLKPGVNFTGRIPIHPLEGHAECLSSNHIATNLADEEKSNLEPRVFPINNETTNINFLVGEGEGKDGERHCKHHHDHHGHVHLHDHDHSHPHIIGVDKHNLSSSLDSGRSGDLVDPQDDRFVSVFKDFDKQLHSHKIHNKMGALKLGRNKFGEIDRAVTLIADTNLKVGGDTPNALNFRTATTDYASSK